MADTEDEEFLVLFITFAGCAATAAVVVSDSVCCALLTLLAMGLFLLRLIVDDVLIFFVPFPVPLLLLGLTVAATISDSSFALGESDFTDSNGFVNSKESTIVLTKFKL